MQVSVLLGNWQQVLNYYSKAEATHEMTEVMCSSLTSSCVSSPLTTSSSLIHSLFPNLSCHNIFPPLSFILYSFLLLSSSCLSTPPPPPTTQAHKAQTNLEIGTRLKVAAGLAEMENRKYKNAARYFLQASFDHCQCPDVSLCVDRIVCVCVCVCV